MTKPTQDKETLQEAVARAICEAEGYSYIPSEHYDRLADAAIATMFERLRTPSDGIGAWLSAALDDPSVCEEMKADIRAWFDALESQP